MERSLHNPDAPIDGESSKERILGVASHLMATRGYSGTSIAAIIKRTGVGPSTLYWHFGSKEGLLVAVAERCALAWVAEIKAAVGTDGSPDEQLTRFVNAIAASIRSKPQVLRLLVLVGLERTHVDATLLASIHSVRRHACQLIAEAIANMLPVSQPQRAASVHLQLAELMMVFVDGVFIAHQIDPQTDVDRMFSWLRTSVVAVAQTLLADNRDEGMR